MVNGIGYYSYFYLLIQPIYSYVHRYSYAQSSHTPVVAQQHYPATLHLFTHSITLIYPAALRKLHSNFAISYTRAPHLFTQQHYTHLRSNVTLT